MVFDFHVLALLGKDLFFQGLSINSHYPPRPTGALLWLLFFVYFDDARFHMLSKLLLALVHYIYEVFLHM